MTLTQLNAFVLVARLGSVRAAASALGVSEPAVSQALTALRNYLVRLGWAHGAFLTTFPGDTSMARLEEVEAFARGGSARVQR